jgi:nucleoside-diphosphate-sugar epimerase
MPYNHVLITGGAGFFGTHLARNLLESGTARAVTSLDLVAPADPVPGVNYLEHDVRRSFPDTLASDLDAVFNLAAVHRTPGHADYEYFETNVAGATNATAFCDRAGIGNLVFTSSISVYGPSDAPLDEDSPIRPNHAYGRSKWLAEEIHRCWLQRGGNRRLVIVRPAVVFGRGEHNNYTRLVGLLQRGLFVYPGRSDTRKACGYVKELAHSLKFALERANPYYLYNFAFAECPTTKEICELLVRVAELTPPRGTVPLAPLEFLAAGFEALNAIGVRNGINRDRIRKLINSTHILPRRLVTDHYSYRFTLQSAFIDWIANDPDLNVRLRSTAQGIHPGAARQAGAPGGAEPPRGSPAQLS